MVSIGLRAREWAQAAGWESEVAGHARTHTHVWERDAAPEHPS